MNISSQLSNRLAELNTQILELEKERVQLLQQELSNAEARTAEIASFIGVYGASSNSVPAAPSKPAPTPSSKPAGETNAKAKTKATPNKKKKSSGKSSGTARVADAIAVVTAAGPAGISALQLSKDSGIPYGAIRKLLSEGTHFRQVGEKRASRIFLK